MKPGLTAVLSLAILFFGLLLPGAARADITPVDCSKGCHVITCNESNCSLWRCDNGGCRHLSSWPREWSVDPLTSQGSAASGKAPPSVAYAKVCSRGDDCRLYQISVDRAVLVGRFDNIDDAVREPTPAEAVRRRR